MRPTGSNEPGRYQRFRQLIHEGAKFGIVGLLGIFVTNLVFIPLHNWLRLGPLTSVTAATAMATVVTFLGNRHWSFAHREGAGTGREGATFFMLNGIGLLIQYAVLGFSNYVFGLTGKLENVIAVNIGIGLGTLFRFWSYRKLVWVAPEVRLAQLRRGRHRRGRTTPVPPSATAFGPIRLPTHDQAGPQL
jgi:putative flippase GtrA